MRGDPAQSAVTSAIPTSTGALLELVDLLWGELSLPEVLDLQEHCPDAVDACKAIHELLHHDGPER